MSERRTILTDLPHAVREYLVELPVAWRRWREDLSNDHTLFWRTPAVRIALWILLGVALLIGLRSLISFFAPAGAGRDFTAATPTATLYVACTNPQCLHTEAVQRPMDFKDWPLTCTACGVESVYRASLCDRCRNWYAVAPGKPDLCPACAARDAKAAPVVEQVGPKNPDDEEDDW